MAGFRYRISAPCSWQRSLRQTGESIASTSVLHRVERALHIAEKLMGSGYVEARDISEYKVQLMQENIERTDAINIRAAVKDATVVDEESIRKADIVLADVPCSGLGVIGKKQDIKYKMSAQRQQDIIRAAAQDPLLSYRTM